MQDPSQRPPFHLIYACWFGGLIGTVLGIGAWVSVLRGGRVYYKNAHRYLTTVESGAMATGILLVGLALLWVTAKLYPPEK